MTTTTTLTTLTTQLTQAWQKAGGFTLAHRLTPEILEIQRQAKAHLLEIRTLLTQILAAPLPPKENPQEIPNSSFLIPNSQKIPNSSFLIPNSQKIPNSSFLIPNLGSVPSLLDSYDILHRIVHSTPCYDYLRQIRLATADRWAHGDKTITATDIALLLLSEADRDPLSLPQRYVTFARKAADRWIRELNEAGTFAGIPADEARRRLAYLLRTDHPAHFATPAHQRAAKAAWSAALPA